jgi:Family of unknown function (DUF6325)
VTSQTPELDTLCPIDYLVVEFPVGHNPEGASLRALGDVVSRGVIRVLDLVCVRKAADGTAERVAIEEVPFTGDVDLSLFAEASSGLVSDDDLAEVASVLDTGTTGAILVYENTWASGLARELQKSGAQFVAYGSVPVDDVLAALETDA